MALVSVYWFTIHCILPLFSLHNKHQLFFILETFLTILIYYLIHILLIYSTIDSRLLLSMKVTRNFKITNVRADISSEPLSAVWYLVPHLLLYNLWLLCIFFTIYITIQDIYIWELKMFKLSQFLFGGWQAVNQILVCEFHFHRIYSV